MANWALLPGVGVSAGTSALFFGDARDLIRSTIGDDLLGDLREYGRYDRYRDGVLRYDDLGRLDWIELREGSLQCEAIDLLRDTFEDVARYCAVRDGHQSRWREGVNFASSTELGVCVGGVHKRGDRDPRVGWVGIGADAKAFGQVTLHVVTYGDEEMLTEDVEVLELGDDDYRLAVTPMLADEMAKSDIVRIQGTDSTVLVRGTFFGVQIFGNVLNDPDVRRAVESSLLDIDGASVDEVVTDDRAPNLSASIPVRVGVLQTEQALDDLVSPYRLEWMLTNVYADDGVTELGWWRE